MTVGNTHKISTAGGTKGWVAYLFHLLESRVCGQWILLFNHTEYCTIVAESHCNCCHNSCSGKCTAYNYPGWWVISTPWKIISTLWWYIKKHDWNTSISHRSVCVCQVLLKWITLQLLSYTLFQESALHIAAQNGDLKWVKSLVDGRTNINITDENGVSVWLNIYPNIPCNSSQLLAYASPSEDSTACGSRKGLF